MVHLPCGAVLQLASPALASFRRLRYGLGLAVTLLVSLSPRSCRTHVPASQLNARLAHFWVSGVAPSRVPAVVWLHWRHRLPDGPTLRASLVVGTAFFNLRARHAHVVHRVRRYLPVPRPCRIPTAVSSGSVRCLIGLVGGIAALSRVCSCFAVELRAHTAQCCQSLPCWQGRLRMMGCWFLFGAAIRSLGSAPKAIAARHREVPQPRGSRPLRTSVLTPSARRPPPYQFADRGSISNVSLRTVQTTVFLQQVHFLDRVVDVPVETPRQVQFC